MKTCKDCLHYGEEVVHEGNKVGHCFRYPPQLIATGSSVPPVRPDLHKCGEFKAKGWFKK